MIQILPNWHPVFVHFTVGLLSVAVVIILLAALLPTNSTLRERLMAFAHGNLRLGYLFALVTAYFGWLAFNSVHHDELAHQVMNEHRDFALLTLGLFAPFFLASWFWRSMGKRMTLFLALALLVPGASLVRTGWLGGELVFHHGLGVQRLPKVEAPSAAGTEPGKVVGMPPQPVHNGAHDHKHSP